MDKRNTRHVQRRLPARSRKRGIWRWSEVLLLLAGVAAVDVWIWSHAVTGIYQSWQDWVFDREVQGRSAPLTEFITEKMEQTEEWVKAWCGIPAAGPKPTPPPSPTPPPAQAEKRPETRPEITRPPKNGLIGRLKIPRLHLSAMVREGVAEDTLSVALGHIPSTALPGQPGNVGVAGHRDTLFRSLRKIRKNDLIQFQTLAGRYTYEVESTEIVKPNNVSVLQASDHPALTLVTCYPFYYVGSAPDRFIVKAREVTETQSAPPAIVKPTKASVSPQHPRKAHTPRRKPRRRYPRAWRSRIARR